MTQTELLPTERKPGILAERESSNQDAGYCGQKSHLDDGLPDQLRGRIFTARYSNKTIPASGLVPVRITRFAPRWPIAFKLGGSILDFAPSAALLKAAKAGAPFEPDFEIQLGKIDPSAVCRQMLTLMGEARGLVLLCFEDVRKGLACHRTQVANWLNTFGIDAKELPEA